MKLIKGDIAPNFEVTDCFGNTINLREFANKKILLTFFRNSSCPFCSMRAFQLIKKQEEFERRGWKYIFVFESRKQVLMRSTFHSDFQPIPLVSDPEKELYNLYGVSASHIGMIRTSLSSEMRKMKSEAKELNLPSFGNEKGATNHMMPADFVICTKTQKIELAYYGKMAGDHVPISELI